MSFTESNTVEQMILDAATSLVSGAGSSVLREDPPAGWGGSLGEEFKPSRWTYVAATARVAHRPADRITFKVIAGPRAARSINSALVGVLVLWQADGSRHGMMI